MNTIYVLLMIWSTSHSYGGVGVIQQEFSSIQACETARIALAMAHHDNNAVLRAQGCFKK